MKIVSLNQCVALVSTWGSLLLLGLAVAAHSTADYESPPSPTAFKHQVFRNSSSRERLLTSTTTVMWCIAKSDISNMDLQTALDWACGPDPRQGQVNCAPVLPGGSCFDPDTLFHHASYAFNDYFQLNNEAGTACNFSGTATVTNVNPSQGTCQFTRANGDVGSPPASSPASSPPASSPPASSPPASSPASSSVVTPARPPQLSFGVVGFEPSYFFCMSTVLTLTTYLIT